MSLRVDSAVAVPGQRRTVSGFQRRVIHVGETDRGLPNKEGERSSSSKYFLLSRGEMVPQDSLPDRATSRRNIEDGAEVHEIRNGSLVAVYVWAASADGWVWQPGRVQPRPVASTMRRPAHNIGGSR